MRLTRHATVRDLPDADPWPAWVPATARRRVDPLTRLACAAVEGLLAAGAPLNAQTAVVVATSYGSIEATLRFIASVRDFGDAGASPTPFTASVHNACAGALGELLGLRGAVTTISQGGTATLAALRWAGLLLAAARAPAVLLVAGDRHTPWSVPVTAALSGARWPIGGGVAAWLLEAGDEGPGRVVRSGRGPAGRALAGAALTAVDAALLGAAAPCAADVLGAWWPTCLPCAADLTDPRALQLREAEGGSLIEAWLGPRT